MNIPFPKIRLRVNQSKKFKDNLPANKREITLKRNEIKFRVISDLFAGKLFFKNFSLNLSTRLKAHQKSMAFSSSKATSDSACAES